MCWGPALCWNHKHFVLTEAPQGAPLAFLKSPKLKEADESVQRLKLGNGRAGVPTQKACP